MFHNCAPSYQWGHKSTLPENTSTQNKGDWTSTNQPSDLGQILRYDLLSYKQ